MRLAAGTARSRLMNGNVTGADDLVAMIERESTGSVDVVRRILDGLRPHALDAAGLEAAIRERATTFDRPGEFDVVVDIDDSVGALDAAVDVAIFRTVSEALMNAARHSAGRHCTVRLDGTSDAVRLAVTDDGTGLAQQRRDGIGLASMSARAEAVGGTVVLETPPGGGTRVVATFPRAGAVPVTPTRVAEPFP